MVIRWVPSVVKLIAFYANLMLLSSFFGLGAGAMTARRKNWRLFDHFSFLVALEIGTLFLCRDVVFSTSRWRPAAGAFPCSSSPLISSVC